MFDPATRLDEDVRSVFSVLSPLSIQAVAERGITDICAHVRLIHTAHHVCDTLGWSGSDM
jgi:hypothetical protein